MLDHVVTGIKTLWTGELQQTYTSYGVEQATGSHLAGKLGDGGLQIFFTAGAGWSIRSIQAEADAQTILKAFEANAGTGTHFYSRHGAQTTYTQQMVRSLERLSPDGVQGKRAVDASRFLTHQDQLEAYYKAMQLQQRDFDMGRVIGDGYIKGTGVYKTTTKVRVFFDNNGNIISIFPLLQ